MNEMEDRWLSITEICKYLGVSNDTVYKWIDRHGMPAHRMGRLWKFKKDEVDEWVKAGGAADRNKKVSEKWAPHANVCAICGSGSSAMQ